MNARYATLLLLLAPGTPLLAEDVGNAAHPGRAYIERARALYAQPPDIGACQAGVLKTEETERVLAAVNEIRALHGLGQVLYDSESQTQVMQASLMFAANARLSHHPGSDWKCHSGAGVEGAGTSNISGGVASPYLRFRASEDDVASWHTDVNNTIADNVGHRRWILDPFVKRIAYGRVSGDFDGNAVSTGSAIKMIYPADWDRAQTTAQFIAYPFGDYPGKYYARGAILSFSVLADASGKHRNASVDFADAEVSVFVRGGGRIAVSGVAYDNQWYGLPNNLQFKAEGVEPGIHYEVRVTGVRVDGEARDYAYWFRILDLPHIE